MIEMKKQTLFIILILALGSIFAVAYAPSTIIDDSSVSTTDVNTVNLHVSGTCTGCGSSGGGLTMTKYVNDTSYFGMQYFDIHNNPIVLDSGVPCTTPALEVT